MEWVENILAMLLAGVLIFVNGFFVAAEFALVKVRGTQMKTLLDMQRPFAKTAKKHRITPKQHHARKRKAPTRHRRRRNFGRFAPAPPPPPRGARGRAPRPAP